LSSAPDIDFSQHLNRLAGKIRKGEDLRDWKEAIGRTMGRYRNEFAEIKLKKSESAHKSQIPEVNLA
jgi:hypothetical protein